MRVEFICSPGPRQVLSVELQLPQDATLQDAMSEASSLPQLSFLAQGSWDLGVWGRRQSAATALKEGDRVEAYRPLRCDPKEARRLRYRQSPPTKRRPAAKP